MENELDPENLESKIREFGSNIFELIGREQPHTFNRNYLSGKIMAWSMKQPNFKINLFRLVDVLPSLKSNRAIANHLKEYLQEPAAKMSKFLATAISLASNP